MSDVINNPPLSDVSPSLAAWFMQVFIVCFAIQQSGSSAQRPTRNLWIGRPYMDVTLGVPIWYNGSAWINSSGVVV